jgi:hypothetical protein
MAGVVIDELDSAVAAAAALVAHRVERLRVGCERLLLAARWADLHPPVREGRGVQIGAEGTPTVAQFAAEELSCVLEVHAHAGRALLADALNLRHRHPRLWARVQALEVVDWVASKTARMVAAAGLDRGQSLSRFLCKGPVGVHR